MSIKDPKGVGDFLWIVFLILIVGWSVIFGMILVGLLGFRRSIWILLLFYSVFLMMLLYVLKVRLLYQNIVLQILRPSVFSSHGLPVLF